MKNLLFTTLLLCAVFSAFGQISSNDFEDSIKEKIFKTTRALTNQEIENLERKFRAKIIYNSDILTGAIIGNTRFFSSEPVIKKVRRSGGRQVGDIRVTTLGNGSYNEISYKKVHEEITLNDGSCGSDFCLEIESDYKVAILNRHIDKNLKTGELRLH